MKILNIFMHAPPSELKLIPKQFFYTYIVNVVLKVRASPFRELAVLANGVATMFSAPDLSIIT